MTMTTDICPACGKRKRLTKHHIKKFAVYKDDSPSNIIYLCQNCHNYGLYCLEELIRQRENNVLRQMPELYTNALKDYLAGVRPIAKKKRKKRNGN